MNCGTAWHAAPQKQFAAVKAYEPMPSAFTAKVAVPVEQPTDEIAAVSVVGVLPAPAGSVTACDTLPHWQLPVPVHTEQQFGGPNVRCCVAENAWAALATRSRGAVA